jgi:hypothetical protein
MDAGPIGTHFASDTEWLELAVSQVRFEDMWRWAPELSGNLSLFRSVLAGLASQLAV